MKHGDALAEWRLAQGLTQEAAGAKIKVSQQAWAAWEQGQTVPSLQSAMAIERLTDGRVLASGWTPTRSSRRRLRRVHRKSA